MTVEQLKTALCTWINGLQLGCPAIVTPTSNPAPAGKYIAVRDLGVEQYGEPLRAAPSDVADENDTRFIYVADMVVTEVEGKGDTLREIRNRLQLPVFREWAEGQGFSVWDIGPVMNNDMAEGEFWVKQKSFTFGVNFVDEVAYSGVTALSAGIEVDGEAVDVEQELNNNP